MTTTKPKGRAVPEQPAPRYADNQIAETMTIPVELAAVDAAMWYFWQAAPMRPKAIEGVVEPENNIHCQALNLLVTRTSPRPAQVIYVLTALATRRIIGRIVLAANLGVTHIALMPSSSIDAPILSAFFGELRPALEGAAELPLLRTPPWVGETVEAA